MANFFTFFLVQKCYMTEILHFRIRDGIQFQRPKGTPVYNRYPLKELSSQRTRPGYKAWNIWSKVGNMWKHQYTCRGNQNRELKFWNQLFFLTTSIFWHMVWRRVAAICLSHNRLSFWLKIGRYYMLQSGKKFWVSKLPNFVTILEWWLFSGMGRGSVRSLFFFFFFLHLKKCIERQYKLRWQNILKRSICVIRNPYPLLIKILSFPL